MVSNAKILASLQLKKTKAIMLLQDFELPAFLLPAIVYFESQEEETLIKAMEEEILNVLIAVKDKQFVRLEWTITENGAPETKVYTGSECELKTKFVKGDWSGESFPQDLFAQRELLLDLQLNDSIIIFRPFMYSAIRRAKQSLPLQKDYSHVADLIVHLLSLRLMEILHLALEKIVIERNEAITNLKYPFYFFANPMDSNTFLIYSITEKDLK